MWFDLSLSLSLSLSLYLPPFVLLSQFCFVLVLEGFEGFCYLCLGLIYSKITSVKSVSLSGCSSGVPLCSF